MADESGGSIYLFTDGGVVASHPPRQTQTVLVAPSTLGEINTIQEQILPVACVRMDDIRFEFDSSFVAPKVSSELKLLAILRREIPGMPVSVFGHSDPVDDDHYNKQLSGRRAQAVYALLTRRTDLWEDLFNHPFGGDDWGTRAIQVMLRELGHYSGPINGEMNKETGAAVEAFQLSEPGVAAGLAADGDPGEKTRPVLYRAYMNLICVDDKNIPFQLDPKKDFVGREADAGGKGDYQGCSEFNPVLLFSKAENDEFKKNPDKTKRDAENKTNRRVLLFLFRPGFRISPENWPCPRAKEGVDGCRKRFFPNGDERRSFGPERREYAKERANNKQGTFACSFYNSLASESPCETGPSVQTILLHVHLRLRYLDPEKKAHDFPPHFPLLVKFEDGTTQPEKIGESGKLSFEVDRRKKAFTLQFTFSEPNYLATATKETEGPGPERLISESEFDVAAADHYRMFSLPLDWTLADSKWDVDASAAPNFSGGKFGQLETCGNLIGSEAAPVEIMLDPCWQYFKFIYFDRKLHKRIVIPPIVLEGFRDIDGLGGVPDARSNWTITHPRVCQCLPWILRNPPKPDEKVLVQFKTPEHTYIESFDDGAQKIVSGTPQDIPSADRLRFYDLPELWQSRKYFARCGDGTGGLFEKLSKEGMSADAPLIFSLDDIILVDLTGKASSWVPADRVAIFDNRLQLFKPDIDDKLSFLTKQPASRPGETPRNYIDKYPAWTRLVIANGEVYDVFAERTRSKVISTVQLGSEVVGARAARHRFHLKENGSASHSPFFSIVENYSQEHHHSLDRDHPIGRSDLLMVRCCGAEGGMEVAALVQYFRFAFDHQNLKGDKAKKWNDAAVRFVEDRWNAKDFTTFETNEDGSGSLSWDGRERAILMPQDNQDSQESQELVGKIKFRVRWFVQAVEDKIRHTRIRVMDDDGQRAYMAPDEGALAESDIKEDNKEDNKKGKKNGPAAVHECGHASSLGDEYIERNRYCSYNKNGFIEYKLGAPYELDRISMMNGNLEIRSRHYWHLAEWLYRELSPANTKFEVRRGIEDPYHIPYNPTHPRISFLNWPINWSIDWPFEDKDRGNLNGDNKGRGHFNFFLYPLGADAYSRGTLRSGQQFDSILSAVVRMRFVFPIGFDYSAIYFSLDEIDQSIKNVFCDNLNFKVNGKNISSCFIYISPRYLVDKFTNDKQYIKSLELDGITGIMKKKKAYAERVETIAQPFEDTTNGSVVRRYYTVEVKLTGRSEWVGGSPSSSRMLQLRLRDKKHFWKFFAEMLGLKHGELPTATNLAGIASLVDGGKIVPM